MQQHRSPSRRLRPARRRNRAIGLLAASGLALSLAACASDSGAGDTEGGTQTVTWAASQWVEPGRGESLWAVAENADESLDAVELEQVGIPFADFISKLQTQMGAGGGPDMFTMSGFVLRDFVDAGLIEPLDDYLPPDALDNLRDTNSELNIDGKQYGYVSETSTYGLIWNQDLLDEAGIEQPTTPEEFVAAVEAVKENTGKFGFAMTTSPEESSAALKDFKLWVLGYGGDLSHDGELTLNDPAAVEALTTYKELYDSGAVPVGASRSTYREMFGAGELGFMLESNGALGSVVDARTAEFEIGVGAPPFENGATIALSLWFAVNANSEKKAEAASVIEQMMSADRQAEWIVPLGGALSGTDIPFPDEVLETRPFANIFAELTPGAYPSYIEGFAPDNDMIASILFEQIEAVMLDQKSPQQALDDAQAEALDALG